MFFLPTRAVILCAHPLHATMQDIHSFHWCMQNVTFPCCSQELLPFLSFMYFFLLPFSTNYSSISLCYVLFPAALLHQLFFHSSLLCTFSCHPSPPIILPFSLTSSCHLFLGLCRTASFKYMLHKCVGVRNCLRA